MTTLFQLRSKIVGHIRSNSKRAGLELMTKAKALEKARRKFYKEEAEPLARIIEKEMKEKIPVLNTKDLEYEDSREWKVSR